MDDDGNCKCNNCLQEFNFYDSIDYEWDLMHKSYKENITMQMCIDYLNGGEKGKKILDRFGEYGIWSSISQHTGIRNMYLEFLHDNTIIKLTRLIKIRRLKSVLYFNI
jgi:hypothetical protein